MEIVPITHARLDEAVDVLSDAFDDYPVMRFVVGDEPGYPRRLRALIGFFTAARLLSQDLVLGLEASDGALTGVANVTTPGARPASPALDARREALWRDLGGAARERYETLGRTWQTFTFDEPHYHLNMIGVRRAHQGQGLARLLLNAVHKRAAGSHGVSLTTELAANVRLYQHVGYVIRHHQRVAELETWGLFRPSAASLDREPLS
jgi:GNAT superfamily N-acetyltransferase